MKTKIPLTFREYILLIRKFSYYRKNHPMMRKGQAAYNALADVSPELAKEVNGTEFDPFYKDEALDRFFRYITNGENDGTLIS